MKPSQIKTQIYHSISTMLPLFIWGKPGIGKSDIVRQVAEETGKTLFDVRVSLYDPVELKGLPQITGDRTSYAQPDLFPDKPGCILLLDELTSAPPAVQATMYQLILNRRFGNYQLPDDCPIFAAGNRETDRGVTFKMPAPLANRFEHVEMSEDLQDWCTWAFSHNIIPEIISFLRFRPALLHMFKVEENPRSFPSPRTWEYIHRKLSAGIPHEIEYESISGTIGEGAAAEFLSFLKIFRNLPNPDAVIMDPQNAAVPTDPATLYALCGALTHRATDNNCHRIVQFADRLQAEFSVMLVRDIIKKVPEAQSGEAFIQWATKHSNFIL